MAASVASRFPAAPPPASSRLLIFDTTLRDGEQSPGVSLNAASKLRIGRALAELGVDICEIGFPACAVDLQTVRELVTDLGNYIPATRGTLDSASPPHPMTLAVLARCVKSDIDLAWEVVRSASKPRIHVFYATSDIHLHAQAQEDAALKRWRPSRRWWPSRARCARTSSGAQRTPAARAPEFLAQACRCGHQRRRHHHQPARHRRLRSALSSSCPSSRRCARACSLPWRRPCSTA